MRISACLLTLVLCGLLPAADAPQNGKSAMPDFKEDFSSGLDNWTVEKWEENAVQVKVENGKLRVDTQSKEHGMMLWLKRELPADFVFEYDFTPLTESGFFLIFFCQKGTKGEDILDEKLLKDRAHPTLFKKYTLGRDGYHISYRRNEAANCNLRKNAGQVLLKQQTLDIVLPKDKPVHVKLTKQGGRIKLEVDGKLFMEFEDKDKPYAGGRIGLRQVYESSGAYDNFTLTELK